MFKPKIPTNPTPTVRVRPSVIEPTAIVQHAQYVPPPSPVPTAPAPVSTRPTVQLTPGALALAVGGGIAAVLVVGAVLVSMLLAVAITAMALAICALVIRSLIASQARGR
ncbi:SpdD-like protein [Streptomyces sp. NPDC050844]|uniref:SpdD-like protein n=1 Tax=Streptomyces sp. NPDC050844 TaxID=3155790 RepID=UPI0033D06022